MLATFSKLVGPIEAVVEATTSVDPAARIAVAECRKSLAEHFDVMAEHVAIGDGFCTQVVNKLVSPNSLVLLAEPTVTEVSNAVLSSEGRYVDAGRNHRFDIDVSGWRSVLSTRHVKLAYVACPDHPTQTQPSSDLTSLALAGDVPVLLDTRHALVHQISTIQPLLLTLLSFEVTAGVSGPEVLIGPSDLVEQFNGVDSTMPLVDYKALMAALAHPHQVAERVQKLMQLRDDTCAELSTLPGVSVCPSSGLGIWVRVAGVSSLDIAQCVNHSGIIGDASWTWRDAVLVAPVDASERSKLMDAFRSVRLRSL